MNNNDCDPVSLRKIGVDTDLYNGRGSGDDHPDRQDETAKGYGMITTLLASAHFYLILMYVVVGLVLIAQRKMLRGDGDE